MNLFRALIRSVMAWMIRGDLPLTIRMGHTRGLRLERGMRRKLTEQEGSRVADAFVDRVLRSNGKIEVCELMEGYRA